ncbi:MAG TPA: 2-oxoglutarate dehydrogenase, E2 component, dihydrolipoamide succinyltransferase, partial [Actinobacteria bacterium]|nr:2-oxoglutarate dehydrogenase, E2 component, dihydrolipoamide succinyltransferase [Actinomycetota bacterium]
MPVTVTMPQLGESVTEGTITRWLKAVGDTVAADEPLLEVSTDKVDTEIPAPASGVLLSIDATEDDTVEVGGVLAVIGEPDDAAAAPSSEPSEPVVADTPAEPTTQAEAAPSEPATPEPATPEPA